MNQIAEIVTFSLAPGVAESEFLGAVKSTKELIESQPGFISRHVSKDADGRWTDYVQWKDQQSVDAANKAVMEDEGFVQFIGLIDQSSLDMRHEPTMMKVV